MCRSHSLWRICCPRYFLFPPCIIIRFWRSVLWLMRSESFEPPSFHCFIHLATVFCATPSSCAISLFFLPSSYMRIALSLLAYLLSRSSIAFSSSLLRTFLSIGLINSVSGQTIFFTRKLHI